MYLKAKLLLEMLILTNLGLVVQIHSGYRQKLEDDFLTLVC